MATLKPRKKQDRRKASAPASVLGGFLKEDRRKGGERRKATARKRSS